MDLFVLGAFIDSSYMSLPQILFFVPVACENKMEIEESTKATEGISQSPNISLSLVSVYDGVQQQVNIS